MYSLTKHKIGEFDNQHEFERMCADILNALGYKNITPIAPKGGSDGGRDITFETETGGKGLACVTLREDIKNKFKEDFHQRQRGEFEKYYLFSNRYISAKQKLIFAKYCISELDAELITQDNEALRSLLDSALKEVRLKYLHIDNDNTEQIKKHLRGVIKYSATLSKENYKDKANKGEWIATTPMEREIYYYITGMDDEDIVEIPTLGVLLLSYKENYYSMVVLLIELIKLCRAEIRKITKTEFQFIHGWDIYFRYYFFRNSGLSQKDVKNLIPTNYDISYQDCEDFLKSTKKIESIQKLSSEIGAVQNKMQSDLKKIKTFLET